MHWNDRSIGHTHGFFFVPVAMMTNCYLITVGGLLEKKLGVRILSTFGILTAVYCHLIIRFVANFWILLFSFVIFGVGFSMSLNPMLKTCTKYFPEKRGIITGLAMSAFGFSPLVFTSLADYVINPKKVDVNQDGMYPEHVANRIRDFALYMAIIMAVFGVIAFIFIFPVDNIVDDAKTEDIDIGPLYESSSDASSLRDEKSIKELEFKQSDNYQPLRQAALSLKFWLFNIMTVGIFCIFYLIYFSFWRLCN